MLLFRKNTFSKYCTKMEADEVEAIKYEMQNPSEEITKTLVPHWAFYDTLDEPYGEDGEMFFISDNMVNCTILMVDFDDGYLFDDMMKDYKDIEFYAHTSFSHKPEHNKFRMLIPLDKPMKNSLFSEQKVRQWFFCLFPHADKMASFKTLQGQIMPCFQEGNEYIYHFNEPGKRLTLPIDKFEKWQEDLRVEGFNVDKSFTELHPKPILACTFKELMFRNKVRYILEKYSVELENLNYNRGSGSDVHGTFLRMANFMQHAGYENWYKFFEAWIPIEEQSKTIMNEISRMTHKSL